MCDLTVTGTRPNSARDQADRSHNKYHKVSSYSRVDETLFGKGMKGQAFAAPWDKKDNRGRMLLWAPPVRTDANANQPTPVKSCTPRRNKVIKFRESYIDESLFGPKLKSSFKAPWGPPSVTPEPHLANPLSYSERVEAEKRLNEVNGTVLSTRPLSRLSTRPLSRQDFRPSSRNSMQPNSSRPGSSRSPLKVTKAMNSDYWPPPSGASSVASTARPAWR